MTKYIDKSALVAEIERLRENQRLDDRHGQGVLDGLHAIEKFLNDLEVKEVDLEKELNDYGYHYDYVSLADRKELMDFAKHFFELGLKTKQTTI